MTKNNKVVSHAEWIKARKKLLVKEKQFTRLRAQMSEQQRKLPWEAVTQDRFRWTEREANSVGAF